MSVVEVLRPSSPAPLVLLCEHASNQVVGVPLTDSDRELLTQHWGYDIGAAQVVHALSTSLDAAAALARISRLICDLNRGPDSPTLFLKRAGDVEVSFNRDLTPDQKATRLARIYHPYHQAVDALIREQKEAGGAALLISIHSFTPVYDGKRRAMEVGVLFDEYDDLAERLADACRLAGFVVALNEPYSGKDGMIFSAARHGRAHQVPFLEIELRQDTIDTPDKARAVAARLADPIAQLLRAVQTSD